MKVCILGWYGTETLGDRAILDGILQILKAKYGSFEVKLASLYPFFTERTLFEDKKDYSASSGNAKIEIIDEYSKKELFESIKESDLILMGGGPLMEIKEMKIILEAFNFARKLKKKTAIFGCGLGPLNGRKEYVNLISKIFKYSDLIIFRDKTSIQTAEKLFPNKYSYTALFDPALISVLNFRKNYSPEKKNYIACNIRKYTPSEYGNHICQNIDFVLANFLTVTGGGQAKIRFCPMHTFTVGGDDRLYQAKIKHLCNKDIFTPFEKPFSLYELYKVYSDAESCIGMRYHSILCQLFLNGKNIMLDYTNPKNGKIISFLRDFFEDENDFKNSYVNLPSLKGKKINAVFEDNLSKIKNFPDVDCAIEDYLKIL